MYLVLLALCGPPLLDMLEQRERVRRDDVGRRRVDGRD
jgi:hypothetical protein